MPTKYKSKEEKLTELSEKINKLEEQKKQIQSQLKQKERRERTRRLIQIGAIIENMGIDNIELAESFKNYFSSSQKNKDWLQKFIEKNTKKVETGEQEN